MKAAKGLSSADDAREPLVLQSNPDDPEKSFRGRLYYVQAISQYIHGFWESLRDDVCYACQFFDLRAGGQPIPEGMQESAQVCFDHWLWDWQIVDEWLMDTCRHTLDAWATAAHHRGREVLDCHPLPVFYGPNESNLAAALGEFNPVFDQPCPAPLKPLSPEDRSSLLAEPSLGLRIYEANVKRESAVEFKKRMRAQFEAQLAKYVARCEGRLLEQRNMSRDAAWTALFQFGQTPKKIEAWEFDRSGEAFSYARIQQSVKKFADAIGLTLRRPKAGRNAKGKNALGTDAIRKH